MRRKSVISVFILILIALVSCSTVDVKVPEAPVQVEVPVTPAAPVVSEPEVVEDVEVKEVFQWSCDLGTGVLTLSAEEGKAVLSYPSEYSADEVKTVLEAVKANFSALEAATVVYEENSSVTIEGLSLDTVENLTVFLTCTLDDYVKSLADPSFVPLTKLSVSEDSVTYEVNTEDGTLTFVFTADDVTLSFPENFSAEKKEAAKAYLSESLGLALDENNSAALIKSLSLAEVLTMIDSADSKAQELVASVAAVPEKTEEAVVQPVTESVPLAEAVSKALETAEQIAVERSETVQGSWISANPLMVILSVVGFCILLGILYYFTVHKPKLKKNRKR